MLSLDCTAPPTGISRALTMDWAGPLRTVGAACNPMAWKLSTHVFAMHLPYAV